MVVGPEETGVVPRGDLYVDVDEKTAVVAVPDSDWSIPNGCRNAISPRGVFRRDHPIPVMECLHLFASRKIPNDSCEVVRSSDESRRVR